MPWTERVELAVGVLVVGFIGWGAVMGLRQLSEEDAMTFREAAQWILGAIVVVVLLIVLVWVVRELLDEEDGVDASALPAGVETAGRGWERGLPYEVFAA